MLPGTPRSFVGPTTFCVKGMTSQHCQRIVTEAIAAIDGVDTVIVDPANSAVTVTVHRPIDRVDIAAAIDDAGYTVLS